MNRYRIPKQQRRNSLPATASFFQFGNRTVPEGSDTFQKALEELYSSEPNHAPSRNSEGVGLSGLNNIIEGDESHYNEPDDEANRPSDEDNDVITIHRRHSSPAFPETDEVDGHFRNVTSASRLQNSLTKSHTQFRKYYFIKHGHWPDVNNSKQSAQRKPVRPKSVYERQKRGKDVAFGSSSTSLTSGMAKLRV